MRWSPGFRLDTASPAASAIAARSCPATWLRAHERLGEESRCIGSGETGINCSPQGPCCHGMAELRAVRPPQPAGATGSAQSRRAPIFAPDGGGAVGHEERGPLAVGPDVLHGVKVLRRVRQRWLLSKESDSTSCRQLRLRAAIPPAPLADPPPWPQHCTPGTIGRPVCLRNRPSCGLAVSARQIAGRPDRARSRQITRAPASPAAAP